MNTSEWSRVHRSSPCKVCGKPDWCGTSRDGSAVCCMRVESPKQLANGGYLHRIHEWTVQSRPQWRPRRIIRAAPATQPDLNKLFNRFEQAANEQDVNALAAQLGVSAESLRRLRIGWDGEAWTFPMRSPTGIVEGIRRRFPNGRKLSIKGGHDGLFIPHGLKTNGLLIFAEGPTDTAALLTLDFDVVGRPSCSGGIRFCIEMARFRDAVVVADGDKPGRNGAFRLGVTLRLYSPSVRLIHPPSGIKDARAWLQAGATRRDIEQAIEAATPLELTIKTDGGSAKPAAKEKPECQMKSYSTTSVMATTAR